MASDSGCTLSTNELRRQAVRRVILSLRSRLDESFSLGSMAALAFASRFHFNRFFHEVTGIPPCQFLYALRLDEAKRLLLMTRLRVADICYEVGYNSLGTFTRRFRDLVGVSPTGFRSQARLWSQGRHQSLSSSSVLDPPPPKGASLFGSIGAPLEFRGLIFIGLFTEPIPQGRPVACTIADGGAFCITGIPDGTFYLFALALSEPFESSTLFYCPEVLRAGGQRIAVVNGAVHGTTYLSLRIPDVADPPILVALSPLLRGVHPSSAAALTQRESSQAAHGG